MQKHHHVVLSNGALPFQSPVPWSLMWRGQEASQGARRKCAIWTLMLERDPRTFNFVETAVKPVLLSDMSQSREWTVPRKRRDVQAVGGRKSRGSYGY